MRLLPPDRLMALLGQQQPDQDLDERPRRIPYPRADQVLYAGPSPDGERKRCGTCWKYVQAGACVEVAGEIDPGQVCGYYVWGEPQAGMPVGAPEHKMTAAEAGLIDTPGGMGTACALCRFFAPDRDPAIGICGAVGAADGLPPVIVDAGGCCTRWEAQPWLVTHGV